MIFEGPNGTFCTVCSMFFGRHSLEGNVVLGKGIFQFVGAFVVENMESWSMALSNEDFVGLLPGIADAGGLTIGKRLGMDGVGVLMIENKDVVIAPTGRDGKASGLI